MAPLEAGGILIIMKYIIKYSPEITIKSRPVRVRFARQLRRNLKTLLGRVDDSVGAEYHWDFITVESGELSQEKRARVEDVLLSTPGICSISRVLESGYSDMESIYQQVLPVFRERLAGRTFAVRCKRAGKHSFSSVDVEVYVGGALNRDTGASGVSLDNPDVLVALEVRDDRLYVVDARFEGIGGYPLGSQDGVLSLISGGFDSAVASYMAIRRGLSTHYCFFNLGGREHEIAVKEVALYLWLRYGASQRVKFVTVPFEAVVAEILDKVDNSQMGVVLKRMMLRAASAIAEELEVEALVTGESVAQVSSQTLRNLAVIDEVTDTLVLRPLIMSDKQAIVDTARAIGTEEFSAAIPEYCGVISVKPTTRARLERVQHEEARFDFQVLEAAIAGRQISFIDQFRLPDDSSVPAPEVFPRPPTAAVVVDIRHPAEEEASPLQLSGNDLLKLPFYKLNSTFAGLDSQKHYLLYCDRGIMSKLHASWLLEQGFSNVGVYRPDTTA